MKQLFSKWTKSIKEQENEVTQYSQATQSLGHFLGSHREKISEAGKKAVEVDGLFSWMAKLRCNRTLWNTVSPRR